MSKFEQFGKFILLEKINSGGMASVFLAKSTGASGISKFIAIKRILPQYSDNVDFIEMFKAEAKIAVNLNHSNVVSIFDFGIERSQFFLAMEFVQGPNLRQILNRLKKNRDNFSVSEIVYIVKEVAAGLDHAHRCLDGTTGRPLNITHRDMSPQNIMVSYEGEVKIVDFGIAKAESQTENTQAGTLKGKFSYMSPEQAEGQSVDPRTDIFSLGIALWELLANDRLFVSNNDMNTLRKVRACQIPSLRKINPSIPAELERITNKALAKDRNLRYQTAAALHKDLNRFLNTHFPEFSPQDFSIHVKSMYSDVIEENRKKFVEYSKITPEETTSESQDGKTEITHTMTQTHSNVKETPDPMENLLQPGTSHKVELETLDKKNKKPRTRRIGPASINTQVTKSVYTQSRAYQTELRAKQDRGKHLQLALILIASLGIAYVFLDSNSSNPVRDPASPSRRGTQQLPLDQMVAFNIQSIPSEADIYVDDVKEEQRTPAQILIAKNKPVIIEVRRPGFLPQRAKVTAKRRGSHQFILPKTEIAMLDITLFPEVGTVVYINDKQLRLRPPYKQVTVSANKKLTIRAVNQYHGEDTKVVRIKPNQRARISLFLRKKNKNDKKKTKARRAKK